MGYLILFLERLILKTYSKQGPDMWAYKADIITVVNNAEGVNVKAKVYNVDYPGRGVDRTFSFKKPVLRHVLKFRLKHNEMFDPNTGFLYITVEPPTAHKRGYVAYVYVNDTNPKIGVQTCRYIA